MAEKVNRWNDQRITKEQRQIIEIFKDDRLDVSRRIFWPDNWFVS